MTTFTGGAKRTATGALMKMAAGALLAAAIAVTPAAAAASKSIPYIPEKFADMVADWETGTWQVKEPDGCFWAYWGCFASQETYNAGVPAKFPLPLNAEAAAENAKVVAALGEGKSIFDPNSQCFPQGLPDRAKTNFKWVNTTDRFYMMINGGEFRTIYMDGREMPERLAHEYTYNGDSVGHWEGDTLVIESRNITGPNTAISPNVPKSDNFWVIERWTPVSADELDVEVTFKDEDRFTDSFTYAFKYIRNAKGDTSPQPRACIMGEGQRYYADPTTGELKLTGPNGAPLEKAED
ncbi:hypothetical protein XM25_14040 [Devosia sp. H5989]|nr:hypothetical protein XM25_14040 [Devosia sp. H5989]